MTLFAVWSIFLCQGESTGWFVQRWSSSCLQVAECQLIDVWFLVPVAAHQLWKHRPVSLTLRLHITFGSGAIRVAKISMMSLEIRLCLYRIYSILLHVLGRSSSSGVDIWVFQRQRASRWHPSRKRWRPSGGSAQTCSTWRRSALRFISCLQHE